MLVPGTMDGLAAGLNDILELGETENHEQDPQQQNDEDYEFVHGKVIITKLTYCLAQ